MLALSIFLLDQSQESCVSGARDHRFLQVPGGAATAHRWARIAVRSPLAVEEVQPVGIQGEAKLVAEPDASNATGQVR